MEYIIPLVEFPLHIATSHLIATRYFPFYAAFSDVQKYEWLAWTSTVMFQTTFTVTYLLSMVNPYRMGLYFLGHVLYDTAFLTLYNRDRLMYIHHGLSILMTLSMNWMTYGMVRHLAAATAFLETSNILLGTVWLLNRAGYGKTLPVKILGAGALVVYLSLRLYFFPRYLMLTASWPISLMMSVFIPLNIAWSWSLVGYYYHIAFATKSGGERLE